MKDILKNNRTELLKNINIMENSNTILKKAGNWLNLKETKQT